MCGSLTLLEFTLLDSVARCCDVIFLTATYLSRQKHKADT